MSCFRTTYKPAGLTTAAYFSTLSWTQYQAARATMAATVAQVMQPDYLVLAEEPDSEAAQAGQPNLNIPTNAAAMVSGEIAAVQALNMPNPQVGRRIRLLGTNLTSVRFGLCGAAARLHRLSYLSGQYGK